MGNTFCFGWEPKLILWLQSGEEALIPLFSKVFSFIGSEMFLVPVLLFLYLSVNKKLAAYAAVNVSVTLVLSPTVKNFVCRRRPYFDLEGVKCLAPVDGSAPLYDVSAQGWSFPSAHSANSLAALGSLALKARKKRLDICILPVILCIGISRFASGNHYPTDVLGGWALGVVCILLMNGLSGIFKSKAAVYGAVFGVSLLGCIRCRTTDYYSGLGIMAGVFAGILYEEKFVNFENTKVLKWRVLRFLGGACVFLAISQGVKIFFGEEFLASLSFASCALRVFRYGAAVFTCIGVYPGIFAEVEGQKREKRGKTAPE